jgi:hypothetical protein
VTALETRSGTVSASQNNDARADLRAAGGGRQESPDPSIVGNHLDDAKRARDAMEEVLKVFGLEYWKCRTMRRLETLKALAGAKLACTGSKSSIATMLDELSYSQAA